MGNTLKLGIVLVLSAFIFFTPVGCAENMSVARKPAHPCCPKPPAQIPTDCARPGCVYVDAKPMVVEAPSNIDHEMVAATEIANISERPQAVSWGAVPERTSLARDPRYLTLHQLLL